MLRKYFGPLSALAVLTLLIGCSGVDSGEIVHGQKAHIVYYEMPG